MYVNLTRSLLFTGCLLFFTACSNTPYPWAKESDSKVLYNSFSEAPKDLDPQRTYTVADNRFLSLCYERLFGYKYLERPLALEPELAKEIPVPVFKRDEEGNVVEVRYSFDLQEGVFFVDDPCFKDGKGREMTADDFIFAFKRLADPKTNCPVTDSFGKILGFPKYKEALKKIREDSANDKRSLPELYEGIGEIEGIQKTGTHSFDLVLSEPYPQILYWLAMRFICAFPHEAIEYYDGEQHEGEAEKRDDFRQHPVGTGPYVFDFEEYNREAKIVMYKNREWWGDKYPERKAPGTIFPEQPGEPADEAKGFWSPERAGQPLAQITRLEWYVERESLPRFNKFIQGYYDASGVPTESFDQVVDNDRLTPEMETKEIKLVKDFGLDVYYVGFNMNDDNIGAPVKFADEKMEAQREKYLKRNQKLRQAMSLAFDAENYLRIFYNKLGVPAQWPLPPGMFGYDPDYKNPYRAFDPELTQARELLKEAGLENGIDPETGQALKLTFDCYIPNTQARVQYMWMVDAWRKLGIDVELAGTEYNKFQEKMYSGSFQLFRWGWLADYPDPENFLFLLYGPNSGKYNGHNPNHAWFESSDYDFYFQQMETLTNDQSVTFEKDGASVTMTRLEIIHTLREVYEKECPWITMTHSEEFLLYHDWMKWAKPHPITGGYAKYYDVDAEKRRAQQKAWNKPILWPLAVVVALLILFTIPALAIIRKERR